MNDYDDYEDEDFDGAYEGEDDFDCDFAEPGGNSALRAATKDNPRIHACPSCEEPDRLTQKDVDLGYQCDSCADADEGGF